MKQINFGLGIATPKYTNCSHCVQQEAFHQFPVTLKWKHICLQDRGVTTGAVATPDAGNGHS